MNRRYVRIVGLVGILVWMAFTVSVLKTNRDLFQNLQSYQQLFKDAEKQTTRITEEKRRWEDKYARTLESWLEWQISSRLNGDATRVESIVLGKNDQGIANVAGGGSQKRYSFRFAFDRNNTALLTDLQPLE